MKCACGYPLREDEEAAGICEVCFMRRMMEIIKEKGAKNVHFLDVNLKETSDPEKVFVIRGIKLKSIRRA
jgi:hypothetical protein